MNRPQLLPVVYVQTYPIIVIDVCPEAQIPRPIARQSTSAKVLPVTSDKLPRSLWQAIISSIWRVR
jgi:hypothetical protein